MRTCQPATTPARISTRRTTRDGEERRARPRSFVELADVSIDVMREADVVNIILNGALQASGGLVVTPNVDHLQRLAGGHPQLREAYAHSRLVVADGQPLLWAARLQGTPLPERVTGSSLLWTVCEKAANTQTPVMLIGGGDGMADRAADCLIARFPGLEVSDTMCPAVGAMVPDSQIEALAARIESSGARIVFLAFGCPKQETLGLALGRRLPHVWFLGVGAAVDMAAGAQRRAPLLVQQLGLEWAFRLGLEPGRLARRYLIDDLPFLARMLRTSAQRRRASQVAHPTGASREQLNDLNVDDFVIDLNDETQLDPTG